VFYPGIFFDTNPPLPRLFARAVVPLGIFPGFFRFSPTLVSYKIPRRPVLGAQNGFFFIQLRVLKNDDLTLFFVRNPFSFVAWSPFVCDDGYFFLQLADGSSPSRAVGGHPSLISFFL